MFFKADDAELFVSSYGTGPRTLVAHGGWVGSGELWTSPFELLSRSWRTVTYDHRGTGATIHTAPVITLDILICDLFRVLDHLDIDRCVLAAESMGAFVALSAALRAPQRFDGLVIVGGRYSGERSAQRERLLAGCAADFSATMDAFVDACVPEEECAAERAWGRQIVKRSNAESATQMMLAVEGVDISAHLASIALPTLVLHGGRDVISPLAHARALAEALPHAALEVLDEAGHVPTITRPQWVADQINRFFALGGP